MKFQASGHRLSHISKFFMSKIFIATIIALFIPLLVACQSTGQTTFDSSLQKYNSKDRATAVVGVAEIKQLARNGDRDAQSFLGAIYASGKGERRNLKKAVFWQKKAAIQGHALAQYNLAVMYSRGMGTPQDLDSAAKWFRRAADRGVAEARLHLGLFHEKGWVLLKCPYAASDQYYKAGHEFLKQGNNRGARKALASIRKILPKYYLGDQLATEIFMHQ